MKGPKRLAAAGLDCSHLLISFALGFHVWTMLPSSRRRRSRRAFFSKPLGSVTRYASAFWVKETMPNVVANDLSLPLSRIALFGMTSARSSRRSSASSLLSGSSASWNFAVAFATFLSCLSLSMARSRRTSKNFLSVSPSVCRTSESLLSVVAVTMPHLILCRYVLLL